MTAPLEALIAAAEGVLASSFAANYRRISPFKELEEAVAPFRPATDAAGREVVTTPIMRTILSGLTVKKPDAELAPPELGPWGSLSFGADHLPGVGPVICLALHHPEGETLIGTLGGEAYIALATGMNEEAEKVMAGDFDQPRAMS